MSHRPICENPLLPRVVQTAATPPTHRRPPRIDSSFPPQMMHKTLDFERCWNALKGRQSAPSPHFYYSVESTGIYCRPGCASRLPLRKNVSFHVSPQAAERAGYRPCKRCKPRQPPALNQPHPAVLHACELLAAPKSSPSLPELAHAVGLSPSHLQKLFTEQLGVSPHGYAQAIRQQRLRNNLPEAATITSALYASGYESTGHFYSQSGTLLGMTPTQYRRKGQGTQMRFAIGQCSLGSALVAATHRGVSAVFLGDAPEPLLEDLQRRFAHSELLGADKGFEAIVAQVLAQVEKPDLPCSLPLDLRGTVFQQRVWQALVEIPPGSTATYKQIAEKLGAPTASRAVAGACGANPVSVLIPCHRVVRQNGELSGYRWGVERKRALLQREGSR